MPSNLKEAVQILLSERTYLIQMVKGLILRVLPKERPKFYDDPFLEMQFQKISKKREQTPEIAVVEVDNLVENQTPSAIN